MHLSLHLRWLFLIVTVAGGWCLLEITDFSETKTWVNTKIKDNGLPEEALFIVTGTVVTAFGLPRQVVCFLGGYAFGFIDGTLIALLASVGGCISSFMYARLLGRAIVLAYFPNKTRYIDGFLMGNPLTTTLLIRLLPVGNNLLTNIAAGISGIQATAFVIGSALGYVPQTVIFSLLGSGTQIDPAFRVSLGIVLLMLSMLLGVLILYHHSTQTNISSAPVEDFDLPFPPQTPMK